MPVGSIHLRVARPADPGQVPAAVRAEVARVAASSGRQEPWQLLRWAVLGIEQGWLEVAATVWRDGPESAWSLERPRDRPLASSRDPFVATLILPTGIGLQTGGFAGDGTVATNLLAQAADVVVTHPNAVNAAGLNWARSNVLYVEGAMLDTWLAGAIALRPVRANRVGVLVDRAIATIGGMPLVQNAIGAFGAVGGGAALCTLTDAPLELALELAPGGTSLGAMRNPDVLVHGARQLVARGADAIALVTEFTHLTDPASDPGDPYLAGRGVDPIGGLEAILSHIVWHAVGVPCAHAPFLWPSAEACDPRVAAEELGGTFIACVLRGLQTAPRPVALGAARAGDVLCPDVVIVPQGAVGGSGTLVSGARGLPLIAVDNPSVLSVDSTDLELAATPARSYAEAAGLVLALAAGLDPLALERSLV